MLRAEQKEIVDSTEPLDPTTRAVCLGLVGAWATDVVFGNAASGSLVGFPIDDHPTAHDYWICIWRAT